MAPICRAEPATRASSTRIWLLHAICNSRAGPHSGQEGADVSHLISARVSGPFCGFYQDIRCGGRRGTVAGRPEWSSSRLPACLPAVCAVMRGGVFRSGGPVAFPASPGQCESARHAADRHSTFPASLCRAPWAVRKRGLHAGRNPVKATVKPRSRRRLDQRDTDRDARSRGSSAWMVKPPLLRGVRPQPASENGDACDRRSCPCPTSGSTHLGPVSRRHRPRLQPRTARGHTGLGGRAPGRSRRAG